MGKGRCSLEELLVLLAEGGLLLLGHIEDCVGK